MTGGTRISFSDCQIQLKQWIIYLKEKVDEIKSSELPITNASTEESDEPASKHHKTALLEWFSEILQEAGASVDDSGNEVDIYLSEPLIEFHGGDHTLE